MSNLVKKNERYTHIARELLRACDGYLFEVHSEPPPFWTNYLDGQLGLYLENQSQFIYSRCPVCGHKLEAPHFPSDFHDPWWIYPQRVFFESSVCDHFEFLSFTILWTKTEPMGAPWIIPCGWGVPSITENLSQNENTLMTVKSSSLSNGATCYWLGFFRKNSEIALNGDFWAIPKLKARGLLRSGLSSRGFWGEFSPLSIHSPLVWSNLYLVSESGELINYETHRDTGVWLQRIRAWNQAAYTQPFKMYQSQLISESGPLSFALGMRSSRRYGAFFITQIPVFKAKASMARSFRFASEESSDSSLFQMLSRKQLKDFAQTDVLWAILDPFQNEMVQDWLRRIRRIPDSTMIPIWMEPTEGESWYLTADSSSRRSLTKSNLEEDYRDLSPLLVKVSPAILDLSDRYALGIQSWGVFFVSLQTQDELHFFLRERLVCQVQDRWVYFKYYDPHFLLVALSVLKEKDLRFLYGPLLGWIIPQAGELKYLFYTSSAKQTNVGSAKLQSEEPISPAIYEVAQRVFQSEQPQRIKDCVRDQTPEFSGVIPSLVLDRWIRESVREAHRCGLRREAHVIKFFLWKVLITPVWCHLPSFVKVLQQPVAEEVKIHQIESLLPQLRLSELPRGLVIEAWDMALWSGLRKQNSPIASTDPEAFHPQLGEPPPSMPLHNKDWLRALGELYQAAYAEQEMVLVEERAQSKYLDQPIRPMFAPPRLYSLNPSELLVREEGVRSHDWLQQHGFEKLTSSKDLWIFRATNPKALLFLAREFLEEFPYVESRLVFETLSPVEQSRLCHQLELFELTWDSYQFWSLKKLSF